MGKITFAFVLVGLISISCVASAPSSNTTTPVDTTTPVVTTKAPDTSSTTKKGPETSTDPNAKTSTGATTNTGTTTFNNATTEKVTDTTGGAGCPKITYGMLFSFISAIL